MDGLAAVAAQRPAPLAAQKIVKTFPNKEFLRRNAAFRKEHFHVVTGFYLHFNRIRGLNSIALGRLGKLDDTGVEIRRRDYGKSSGGAVGTTGLDSALRC